MAIVSAQLKRAIRGAPVTRYRMAREIGVAESTLSRFVNGKSNLDLGTVDKIAAYLGLALVSVKRNRRG